MSIESYGPVVTLITDFNTADGYVGAMKGVVLSICPRAQLVDITHAIPPQDVCRAAFALYNAARFFPAGTIHLAVVDPGVGTPRRPLAARVGGMTYVGPDNGLFTLVLQAHPPEMVVELQNPAYRAGEVSHTFHGRDLFAPTAAHLAAGVPLREFGPAVDDWVALPLPPLTLRPPDQVAGEVVYCDHFGNAVTNIGVLRWEREGLALTPLLNDHRLALRLPADVRVERLGRRLPLCTTYGEVASGAPLALVGSSGWLEIAVRDGSAAAVLGLQPGDKVFLVSL